MNTLQEKKIDVIILAIATFPTFFFGFFTNSHSLYLITTGVLIFLTILSNLLNKKLFSTVLFFTLLYITKPLNYELTKFVGFSFIGIYYIIPISVFTILIMTNSAIRKTIGWWRIDKFDILSTKLIISLSILSAIALYLWGSYFSEDISSFVNQLPDNSWYLIIFNGIGFAILNSLAEEYISRGMLCNGLEKIFNKKEIVIIIQAIIFSIFHFYGFPGGFSGIIMVLMWSLFLGIIRYRTKGIIGVIIAHFFADFAIYLTLYYFK